MSDATKPADTCEQEPAGRRRLLRRWLLAAVAIVLITAVAIPLRVAYDCQRVLNAAHDAGADLRALNGIDRRYLHVDQWPASAKDFVDRFLPFGMKCLYRRQTQVISFDETATISDEWLLARDFSALQCEVCIRIRHPHVSDVGIQSLAQITNLGTLLVPNTLLSDEGLKPFIGHPHLAQLGLHGTQITSDSLPVLTSISNLRNLHVSHTNISGDQLRQLRMCPELYTLAVDAGQLTEPLLSSLSSFPQLTKLCVLAPESGSVIPTPVESPIDAPRVVVDDALLQRILKETTITKLYIEDGSAITDASVPALLKARHIKWLDAWNVGMSADGALKVNAIHGSLVVDEPAVRLPGESTWIKDELVRHFK